ncbi:hypothetical protein IW262DRAFT_1461846 [Armillaria fumosa]|nr:hypothetical protein IW262DRAFT_1461846 [Armillaria fumosa]
MSTSNAVMQSTFLKKLFVANNLTANLVSSILLTANHHVACVLAGNICAFWNSIPPISTDIVPPATRT